MSETIISCTRCGAVIPVSQAITAQIRAELEASLEEERREQLKVAMARAQAESRAQFELEIRDLRAQVAEKAQQASDAQERELQLRKKARELEHRQREMDLELQRRLDEEKRTLEEHIRRSVSDEHGLKLREKEKQIEDLRKSLEDARRKSEQGSQETQGEVMEIDIESVLAAEFPQDEFRPVAKGTRGADIVHDVRNGALKSCGTIIWEVKNTRRWGQGWLDKLKDDQRAANANLAILVSAALPDGVKNFASIDGVWVADRQSYLGVAHALREQLIQVAFARGASIGKNAKMDALYQYLSGDEFRQKVEAIVETFSAMGAQLQRERRAMEKIWKEREKQIQRITLNTVGMYGDMRGIIGASLPEIEALELDGVKMLEDCGE